MRRALSGVVFAACIAACSGFGAEDEEEKPAVVDNSKPPEQIGGTPIPGIYVSSSKGRDGATGFPGSPLKTLKEGMARAKAENLRLIVCAEEYAENVEVFDGVSAYGYFDCSGSDWIRNPSLRARVKGLASPTLIARDIKRPTRLEGFSFIGPDLTNTTVAGRTGSSIAGELRQVAPNSLFFNEVTFQGSTAARGIDGPPITDAPTPSGTFDGTIGFDQSTSTCTAAQIACGNMAVPGVKGPAPTCEGQFSPAPGGDGGDGMWFIEQVWHPQANNDQHGRPLAMTAESAPGGLPCGSNDTSLTCGQGANGVQGKPGEIGGLGQWIFDAEGFIPGTGRRGWAGMPGQSGGGGGSQDRWFYGPGNIGSSPDGGTGYARSSRGGSGGAGGCGGLGGNSGGGGGASIGLLALDAAVVLERVVLDTSNGGPGGTGGSGGLGTPGGKGAAGGIGAGRGGDGGTGGPGGPGSHGMTGPSIALAFYKTPVTKSAETEIRQRSGGAPHPSSVDPLTGKTIPAPPPGIFLPEWEIRPVP